MYAEPGNTAASGDRRITGQFAVQWFGLPGPQQMIDRHHRTVPPLYTNGRLFVPGNNRVFGVDAYNGTVLWNVEVAGSRRVAAMRDCGSMMATADTLYAVAEDRCYGLDAQTGEQRLNLAVPAAADGQPRDWGYVARVGDKLFGTATKPGASRSGHSREQIKETFWDFIPVVTSDYLFCVDRVTGQPQWRYEPRGAIANPTIAIGGGRVYFVESRSAATLAETTGRSKLESLVGAGAELVALDAADGHIVWRQAFDFSAMQHHLYLCYSQEKLVVVGTRNQRELLRSYVWYDLHGFDAASGARTGNSPAAATAAAPSRHRPPPSSSAPATRRCAT
jgi:hypothetical protein